MLNRIGKKLGYKDGGFTIIEVLIVLAVAGLIMAIVLVAIPQLQRNQRNTARREVLGRIKTELDAMAGNNNGKIPGQIATPANVNNDLDSLYNRYLGCGSTANAQLASTLGNCDVNIEDPSSGVSMIMTGTTGVTGIPANPTVQGQILYQPVSQCDGESVAAAGAGNNRVYSMWLLLEGGAIYCLDNN